jgi:hypothetical protein
MRTIKTRTSVKNIKALDKPVNLAGRMKNSLVKPGSPTSLRGVR